MTQENLTRSGHTVVGVFDEVSQAEQAINDLKVAGFTPDSISVVTKDRTAQHDLTEATGNEAGQGTLVGSLGGGTLGAVLGWLLAGGTALIPGIGPVVAAGVFGATVSGALIGGTLGGITGALAGSGIPETEAAEYEEHVRGGRTLITVNAANGNLLEAAMDVFERNGATNTRYYDLSQPGVGHNFVQDNSRTMPVESTTTTTYTTTQTLPTERYEDPNRTMGTTTSANTTNTGTTGGYTTQQNLSPTNSQPQRDPAAANRTIYAEGHSEIASPEEFERQDTRQVGERVDRFVEERTTGGQPTSYQNTRQGGVYPDPELDEGIELDSNTYPPRDNGRGGTQHSI